MNIDDYYELDQVNLADTTQPYQLDQQYNFNTGQMEAPNYSDPQYTGTGITDSDNPDVDMNNFSMNDPSSFVDPSVFDSDPTSGSFDWNEALQSVGGVVNGLAKLFGAGVSYNAANQQGKANRQISQDLLNNADPYRQYRQQAEIPFMLGQMQQYGDVQNTQNNLLNKIASQVTGDNPDAQTQRNRMSEFDKGFIPEMQNYNNLLKQSYSDPMSVYNSNEYQQLADLFGQQIARRDAAKGRLSQYGDRAVEMQGNFLNHLNKYRSGLQGNLQTVGGIYNNLYNGAQTGLNNAVNANTNQLQGLSQLYSGLGNNLNNIASIVSPRGTAGAGANQAAQLQSDAAAYNNYALNPVLQAVTSTFGG